MQPLIKVLWEDCADRALPLPSYETAGAAGADIRANLRPEDRAAGVTLAPMQRSIVPTGIRVEIPEGFEMQIRPRSGLAVKFGITLPNTPGTIDSDYRGELKVLLINLGIDDFYIIRGMRIAQIVFAAVARASVEERSGAVDTERGFGGFGSTGTG